MLHTCFVNWHLKKKLPTKCKSLPLLSVSCSVTVITIRALVFLYLIWYIILDAIFQN